jgi:DNA (cytosine-5)-methyltransferase 1
MLVGAKEAGFTVVGNLEWRDYYRYRAHPKAPSTFPSYFPGAFYARGQRDVPKEWIPGSIDYAAGHPECGLYSNLGASVVGRDFKAAQKDLGDLTLFLNYIAEFRPRFFLMDDLPASFEALPMSEYMRILPDYDLFPEWISNWGYGNIQKFRNRMFIVGALKSEKFVFVPGEEPHALVTRDLIADLEHSAGKGIVPNHPLPDPDYVPGRFVNLRYLGDRPTWGDLAKHMSREGFPRGNKPYYNRKGEYKTRPGTGDPIWDGYCPVLSGGYAPFHPNQLRPLSVRERARIQGFPDDFLFYHSPGGPDETIWEPYNTDGQRGIKQTGKAMPIQFCTFVMKQVAAHIHGKKFKASGKRVLRPNLRVTAAKQEFCRLGDYANQEKACKSCWVAETCEVRKEKGVEV